MKNSTLNLYELADIKSISASHGLIKFFCFEKVGDFGKRYIVNYKILFSHL